MLVAAGCTDAAGPRPSFLTKSSPLVELELPMNADRAMRLRERRSGVELSATLVGARPVRAEASRDSVVYREVFPGAELRHRTTATGTEDVIAFDRTPAEASIRYTVELGEKARALRLVEGTLEVLDAGGAPRLRVSPPFLMDRDGERRPAELRVEGCDVDRDPAAPWRRRVLPLTTYRCDVRVVWDPAIRYPAVLDPVWSITGSMAVSRYDHIAMPVPAGGSTLVLVAGGQTANTTGPGEVTTSTAELYDPSTGTWATTGSMVSGRSSFPASSLGNGEVLVAGGRNFTSTAVAILKSTEIYDPATGRWSVTTDGGSNATQMHEPRAGHTLTTLADGRALVAGGAAFIVPSPTSEIYDPATGTWAYTQDSSSAPTRLVAARTRHSATLLPDGTVLAAGGRGTSGILNGAELYDPATQTWTATTGSMVMAVQDHSATLIGNRVLLAFGSAPIHSELYDVATKTFTATAGQPNHARLLHTATLVAPGGPVLAAGGDGEDDLIFGTFQPLYTAELYVPSLDAWVYAASLPGRASAQAAVALSAGRVLLTGGEWNYSDTTVEARSDAWLYGGVVCTTDTDCNAGDACDPAGICRGANGTDCEFQSQCLSGNCANTRNASTCSPCPTCQELDTNGTCVASAEGSFCGALYCSAGMQDRLTCDGAGLCHRANVPCAGGFGCAPTYGECATSCTRNSQCQAGYYCDVNSSTCLAELNLGDPCTDNSQCQSQRCASTLTGSFCSTCPTCSTLDSSGLNCIAAPNTFCAPNDCTLGVQTTHLCDAQFACNATAIPCSGGFSCSSTSPGDCLGRCAGDADCQPGFACDTGTAACLKSADASAPHDASTPRDASPSTDAGQVLDGSGPRDASRPLDGSRPLDAARAPDGSRATDGSRPIDGSSARDAATADARRAPDAARPSVGAHDASARPDATAVRPPPPIRDAQRSTDAESFGNDARAVDASGGCNCRFGSRNDAPSGAWLVVAACVLRLRSRKRRPAKP